VRKTGKLTTQPEAILEESLVKQLQELGYAKVVIKDEVDLIANLKTHLFSALGHLIIFLNNLV
jgi:hypothetical protein